MQAPWNATVSCFPELLPCWKNDPPMSLSSPLLRTSLRSSAIFTASSDSHFMTFFLLAYGTLSSAVYFTVSGYRSIVLPVLCLPVEVRWTCSSPLQQTPIRCSPRHISVSVWHVWFALACSWHLLSAGCGPSHSQLLVVLSLFLHFFSISFCIWCNRSDTCKTVVFTGLHCRRIVVILSLTGLNPITHIFVLRLYIWKPHRSVSEHLVHNNTPRDCPTWSVPSPSMSQFREPYP